MRWVVALALAFSGVVSAQTTGPQTVLVVPVTAPNAPTAPLSQAALVSAFAPDGPIATTISQWSYGATTFTAPVVLPNGLAPVSWDFTSCSTMLADVLAWAKTYATLQGYTLGIGLPVPAAMRQIVSAPSKNCSWGGMSSTGVVSSVTYLFNGLGVARHELGHAFGLFHTVGPDPLSPMSTPQSGAGHPSAMEKRLLGWIDQPGRPQMLVITASGTYTLEPFDGPHTLGFVAARLIKSDLSQWLTIEAHVTGVGARAFTSGVAVRTADITWQPNPMSNRFVTLLQAGQSYAWDGRQVYVESLGAAGAVVRVANCSAEGADCGSLPPPPPPPCIGRTCSPPPVTGGR